MTILFSSLLFSLSSWACLAYWSPPMREAISLVLTLGGAFAVFSLLEVPLSSRKLPKALALAGPLVPSVTPVLLTGAFLFLDTFALSGAVNAELPPSYPANNFTGVALCLRTLANALLYWGQNGFELEGPVETAVLPRQELLSLLQPQLLQHSSFSCAITLLLGRSGELQLTSLLLTSMAAIVRSALLLQLAAAAYAEGWPVLKPILQGLWEDPTQFLAVFSNPVAAVQSTWKLSTGTRQRLLFFGLVVCLCCSFLLHLARLAVVSSHAFSSRQKEPTDTQKEGQQKQRQTQEHQRIMQQPKQPKLQ
ncbi:hypothetical protein cyc_06805 [Cyclospora cayetanensis]|uniref:Transmembrane protein n=1 Tax=Cyclospora cayetanensis TaxID=88456 RepID=A0A1D3CYJ1_9EIME|nr:hypothetical protein cyc_06805 [Cyclospora cayetanensis]